ncbi:MAG: membrane protein insertion efficiency factor YidD [Clostridia bacterium]|nr:membrane protein insertion efficiency factor YidD [Clostridia bacterium]
MKRIILSLIRFYRARISPLKPPCCRFTPTCSAYALEAFQNRGFFAAFFLTVWRILRCNPFFKAGYDPVPYGVKWKKIDPFNKNSGETSPHGEKK